MLNSTQQQPRIQQKQPQQPQQQQQQPQQQPRIQQQPKIQKPRTQQLQQLAQQVLQQPIREKEIRENKENKEKTSHKQKKQQVKQSAPTSLRNKKVIFKLKNNQVDKFYSPQMALSKLTKSGPIDLESIQDLPEIPLDEVFRTH